MKKKTIILAVRCTSNNTIIHAAGLGNKNIILSAGNAGFKGSKRSTKYAAECVAQKMSEKLVAVKVRKIILVFRGSNKGRKSIIRKLKKKRIKIRKLIDKTPKAHNGCRAKKRRRT
jgi:small subunit ribosomal protein S11